MTSNGGKNFLRTCLRNIDPSLDADKLFCYKYANRKHAADYQPDEIVSSLTAANIDAIKSGVPYVITCFIHLDIFVVWPQSVGRGNGKFRISKCDLIAFEENPSWDYRECIVGKAENSKAYIFRNESGFKAFYKNAVDSSITT